MLITLVKSERKTPNIDLKTDCLQKDLKINYYGVYKSFYWISNWQVISTLNGVPLKTPFMFYFYFI